MPRPTWGERLVACANRTPLAIAVFAVTLVVLGLLTALSEGWNIVTGFWWAVVTASTVGYGDLTPVTALGRILGVITIIVGITGIGIIVGRIAASVIKTRDAWTHEEQEDLKGREDRILSELAEIRELLEHVEWVEDDEEEDDTDDDEPESEPFLIGDRAAQTLRGRDMIRRAADRGRSVVITDDHGNRSRPISSTQITNVYQQGGGGFGSGDLLTNLIIWDALTDSGPFGGGYGGGDTVINNDNDTTVINNDGDGDRDTGGDWSGGDDAQQDDGGQQDDTTSDDTSGDTGGDFGGGGDFGSDTSSTDTSGGGDWSGSSDTSSSYDSGGSSDWSSSSDSGSSYDSGSSFDSGSSYDSGGSFGGDF